MPDAPPIIVPVLLAPTAPSVSAKSFGDNETTSLNNPEDPSAKDAVIHTEDLSHRISKLVFSEANETRVTRPPDPEVEQTGSRLEYAVSTARVSTADDTPVWPIVRKSHTFNGLRSVGLTFGHSNRRPHDKALTSLGDEVLIGIRRSWTWLDWRRLKFDRLEDRVKGAVKSSLFSHQKNFLPQGQLLKLVTQSSVGRELSRWKYIPQRCLKTWRGPSGVRIEAQMSPAGITPQDLRNLAVRSSAFLHMVVC